MEHVRLNLLTADPGLFDKLTTHLEHEVGPRLEEEAGPSRRASSPLGLARRDARERTCRALALDEAAEIVIGPFRSSTSRSRAGTGSRPLLSP